MTLVELIEALMKIDASLGDEPVKVLVGCARRPMSWSTR